MRAGLARTHAEWLAHHPRYDAAGPARDECLLLAPVLSELAEGRLGAAEELLAADGRVRKPVARLLWRCVLARCTGASQVTAVNHRIMAQLLAVAARPASQVRHPKRFSAHLTQWGGVGGRLLLPGGCNQEGRTLPVCACLTGRGDGFRVGTPAPA